MMTRRFSGLKGIVFFVLKCTFVIWIRVLEAFFFVDRRIVFNVVKVVALIVVKRCIGFYVVKVNFFFIVERRIIFSVV